MSGGRGQPACQDHPLPWEAALWLRRGQKHWWGCGCPPSSWDCSRGTQGCPKTQHQHKVSAGVRGQGLPVSPLLQWDPLSGQVPGARAGCVGRNTGSPAPGGVSPRTAQHGARGRPSISGHAPPAWREDRAGGSPAALGPPSGGYVPVSSAGLPHDRGHSSSLYVLACWVCCYFK